MRNILASICFNADIKTDLMQFLRLIMKNRSDVSNGKLQVYHLRNKLINTLSFILEVTASKDLPALMTLFEIEVEQDKMHFIKMSSH